MSPSDIRAPDRDGDPDLRAVRERFEYALDAMAAASSFTRAGHLSRLLVATLRLLACPGGAAAIHAHAHRLDAAGVFAGSDWDHPERLQPELARGSLTGSEDAIAVEALSQLRLLAVACGQHAHPGIGAEAARDFLERSLVLNLDLLGEDYSEAGRFSPAGRHRAAVRALLAYELEQLGGAQVLEALIDEADRILQQRPIDVADVRRMLGHAERLLEREVPDSPQAGRARELLAAMRGPTELSAGSLEDYVDGVARLDDDARRRELAALGESLRRTGLACPAHALVLVDLAERGSRADLVEALGLDAIGTDSLEPNESLVRGLIAEAVRPETAQCILGLSHLLDRGILFFPPVAPALRRIMRLEPLAEVSEHLRGEFGHDDPPPARSLLLAGVISVLGLPLGVSQGNNPTCQSARAISLWAQCDPGFLLEMITWAARDGEIDLHFEGSLIRSTELTEGLVEDLHTDLDTVSLLLVPHLDKIYWEMGRRIVGRGEDGHRWINPEFHGWWVHRGFATTIDYSTGGVIDFTGFIRRFHAAYHPDYNNGTQLIYPQPAGVVATDAFGEFVGYHAIAIQRVDRDADDVMRVYFYNPNNEGRQDWGQGIVTSTLGHGEIPGESSLPFDQFCARLYVFHYNERELGDWQAVPEAAVAPIAALVRDGWASGRTWHEVVPG
jgi:hypothetical protein